MPIKLANNASTRLASPITAASTSITVESGGGDKFPVTGDDVYFPMTIVAADGQLEIVKCTARSSDTFTIERAQEGTAAKDFAAGAAVELRLTAGAMEDVINDAEERLQDIVDSLEGYKVGDYLTTVRNPGPNWLRRDGGVYSKNDYPELGTYLPTIPSEYYKTDITPPGAPSNFASRVTVTGLEWVIQGPESIYYSTDGGENFTVIPNPPNVSPTSKWLKLGGTWYGFSKAAGKLITTTDFSTFTDLSVAAGSGSTGWKLPLSVCQGNLIILDYFNSAPFTRNILWSANPSSGFTKANGPSGFEAGSASSAGDITIANHHSNSNKYLSLDGGKNFTAYSHSIGTQYSEIVETNGQIFAIKGPAGKVALCTNSTYSAFTEINTTLTTMISAFIYDGMHYVAFGTNTLAYSTNLSTWHTHIISETPDQALNSPSPGVINTNTTSALSQWAYAVGEYFMAPDDDAETGWIKAL